MKFLLEELQSEPTVWIRTRLEGQASNASKAFSEAKKAGRLAPGKKAPKTFRGEACFRDENGKLTGTCFDDATGETVVASPVIMEVKPLSFVPPAK